MINIDLTVKNPDWQTGGNPENWAFESDGEKGSLSNPLTGTKISPGVDCPVPVWTTRTHTPVTTMLPWAPTRESRHACVGHYTANATTLTKTFPQQLHNHGEAANTRSRLHLELPCGVSLQGTDGHDNRAERNRRVWEKSS